MRLLLNLLTPINTFLEKVVTLLGGVLVALMVIIVFGGAVTRYLTGIGFNVVLELPPMLMPWLVFPMAGILMRGSSHIAVDFLPDRLGPRGRSILSIVVSIIAVLAGLTFMMAGMQAVQLFKMVGQMTEMEWEFPIWWIYLSFPVGFLILTSFAVENLLKAVIGLGNSDDGQSRAAREMAE